MFAVSRPSWWLSAPAKALQKLGDPFPKSALDSAQSTMDNSAQRIGGTADRIGQGADSTLASTKETANLFAEQGA